MTKPIGGRGKKAPYETIQVRVPLPIKPQVEKLIADYRGQILGDVQEPKTQVQQQSKPEDGFIDLDKIVEQVLADPSITRQGKDRAAAKRAIAAFITFYQEKLGSSTGH